MAAESKQNGPVQRGSGSLVIGGEEIPRRSKRKIEIPVARLPTGPVLFLPVIVVRGRSRGPVVFLDSTIHGDEIDGIDIILNVVDRLSPSKLRGTVIAVPVVNVYGFLGQDRYLPDRRDLNRSFPGNENGSIAARLAHLFMSEVVRHCDYGIDFHSGSQHRTNLPQLRADLSDPETLRLAEAFAPQIVLDSKLRPGSLRDAAGRLGIRCIVHEAGEPSRFDPLSLREGVNGTLRVLRALEMIDEDPIGSLYTPVRISRTRWLRARRSGIMRVAVDLGDRVRKNQQMGVISDIFGEQRHLIRAPWDGIVIGLQLNPIVHRGDALVHVGEL
jgi:uncharacterized protein